MKLVGKWVVSPSKPVIGVGTVLANLLSVNRSLLCLPKPLACIPTHC